MVEGFGDEVLVFILLVVIIVGLGLAWMSTNVVDPPELAAHVNPNGAVDNTLDFPGSIEDDLERIASEIEDEAEAVENEVSVLTLQRAAFLQSLTGRSESGDEDEDFEDEEEEDGLTPEDSPAPIQESIPTFEFPCPHEVSDSDTPQLRRRLVNPSNLSDESIVTTSEPAWTPSPSPNLSLNASPSPDSQLDSPIIPKSNACSISSSSCNASTSISTLPPTTSTTTVASNIQRIAPTIDVIPRQSRSCGNQGGQPGPPVAGQLGAPVAGQSGQPVGGQPGQLVGGQPGQPVGGQPGQLSGQLDQPISGQTVEAQSAQVQSSDGHMVVRIKFLNDVIREMRVKATDTIRDFKAKFFAEELATSSRVRLIFNGQLLADHRSFADYGIINNTVVHCILTRDAGGDGDGRQGTPPILNEDVMLPEFDLTRLVFPLVAVILSCVWYFRVQYRQFFNATSSIALLFLTLLFFFFVFTSLRNRAIINNNVGNDNLRRPQAAAH